MSDAPVGSQRRGERAALHGHRYPVLFATNLILIIHLEWRTIGGVNGDNNECNYNL